VVDIDDRGRLTMPKETGLRGKRAIIIPAGSFIQVIPLEGDPYDYAKDWLKTSKDVKTLKREAEEAAAEDAFRRAERRRTQR